MENNYLSASNFANDVVKHAKCAWVNGTFDVNGVTVAIKAYGKWVQVIRVHGIADGGHFKTQKAMIAFIIETIGA